LALHLKVRAHKFDLLLNFFDSDFVAFPLHRQLLLKPFKFLVHVLDLGLGPQNFLPGGLTLFLEHGDVVNVVLQQVAKLIVGGGAVLLDGLGFLLLLLDHARKLDHNIAVLLALFLFLALAGLQKQGVQGFHYLLLQVLIFDLLVHQAHQF